MGLSKHLMNSSSIVANPQPRIRICAVAECNRPVGKKRSKYCSYECFAKSLETRNRLKYVKKTVSVTERTCAFDGCINVFVVKAWNQKYCGSKCYMLNRKFLLKNKHSSLKNETDNFCGWCHIPLKSLQKIYCSSKCADIYRIIQKRIFGLFEGEETDKQQEHLRKLGCKYVFPERLQTLNNFYGLKGEPEK